MPNRRHVHTRSIKVEAYARDDGLWDVEAVLTDTKAQLAGVLPTAAVQAFAGEVFRTHESARQADEVKPWQLDRCHALRTDGPAVAEFYPRWFRR